MLSSQIPLIHLVTIIRPPSLLLVWLICSHKHLPLKRGLIESSTYSVFGDTLDVNPMGQAQEETISSSYSPKQRRGWHGQSYEHLVPLGKLFLLFLSVLMFPGAHLCS